MPDNPIFPSVYTEEIPSGVRSISGVSTSIALFIGRTTQGPLGEPVECLSYGDYDVTVQTETYLTFDPLASQPHQHL